MNLQPPTPVSFRDLWRQFLPLSISDVTMAAGDPMITMTLARMPEPTITLAAMGIAKSIAVLFESPIIMLLHASNALGHAVRSRRALWHFMLLCCFVLTALLAVLSIPSVFHALAIHIMGLTDNLISPAHTALLFLIFWPAIIGWRRYHQGLLIRNGETRSIARAGLVRLGIVTIILFLASAAGFPGIYVGGLALIAGIMAEAIIVTIAAARSDTIHALHAHSVEHFPNDLAGIWRFYWPLANAMLVVWGGRAILIAIIARAVDSSSALAVWPAAWGLTLLIANATRMVQQVIIKYNGIATTHLLVLFTLSVGGLCTIFLLVIGTTSIGSSCISIFVGHNRELSNGVQSVVLLCIPIPLLIAIQNAAQGFLISRGETGKINIATWIGTVILLGVSTFAVQAQLPGATSAAIAMMSASLGETAFLTILAYVSANGWSQRHSNLSVHGPRT